MIPFREIQGIETLKEQGKLIGNWHGAKVLLEKFPLNQGIKEFVGNVKLNQALRHPNIALMMGFSLEKGHGYMISEYFFFLT